MISAVDEGPRPEGEERGDENGDGILPQAPFNGAWI